MLARRHHQLEASGSVFTMGFSKGPGDQFGLGKLPDIES